MLSWSNFAASVLHERRDLFQLGWHKWMQILLYVKRFLFISNFKRSFTCRDSIILHLLATTRFKCKWKDSKGWRLQLGTKTSVVQPHQCEPSVFFHTYIYMCICRLYAHIYNRYTCTVCIVTYIWFYGSSSCCQEAIKKRQSSRLKKIQQQLGTYRQWPSRTVIRHNTDKEDIEGRNTN